MSNKISADRPFTLPPLPPLHVLLGVLLGINSVSFFLFALLFLSSLFLIMRDNGRLQAQLADAEGRLEECQQSSH